MPIADSSPSLRCEIVATNRGSVVGWVGAPGGVGRPAPSSPLSYLPAPASATFERLCTGMAHPTHRPIPRSLW
jgi:hypothetical protein